MGISSWETRRYRRVWKRYLSRHHIDGAWLALGNGGAKEPAAAAEYPHRQQVCHAQAGQAADSTRMPQHGAQNSADIDAPVSVTATMAARGRVMVAGSQTTRMAMKGRA